MPSFRWIALILALAIPGASPAEDDQAALEAWQRHQNACAQFQFEERYVQAVAACGAAVAVAERLEPGPQLEGSLNDLAMAYVHLHRYAEAERLLMRVLGIRVKTLGQDHVMVAGTLDLLAAIYRKMGRDSAARNLAGEVDRITDNCTGHLTDEQKEGMTENQAPDPCTPETVPPFLR
jgi:hypothetical protein